MNDPLMNYKLSQLRQGYVDRALAAAVSGDVLLPVAPRAHEWDGDAARRRVFEAYDTEQERGRAFLWVDGDPENMASYQLGYADVIDGDLTIIPRGVSAARGALSGARGAEIDAPGAADRLAEVEAHVRDVLGEADEPFPGESED